MSRFYLRLKRCDVSDIRHHNEARWTLVRVNAADATLSVTSRVRVDPWLDDACIGFWTFNTSNIRFIHSLHNAEDGWIYHVFTASVLLCYSTEMMRICMDFLYFSIFVHISHLHYLIVLRRPKNGRCFRRARRGISNFQWVAFCVFCICRICTLIIRLLREWMMRACESQSGNQLNVTTRQTPNMAPNIISAR